MTERDSSESQITAFIFGVPHSPWTQIAILACEAKQVQYDLSSNFLPHWRRLVATNGYVFPTLVLTEAGSGKVLSVTGGSFAIMKVLDELLPDRFPLRLAGMDGEAETQARRHHGKLEELFFEGAFERFHPLPQKLGMFPLLFARQPDAVADPTNPPSLLQRLTSAALKAFLMIHFGSFLFVGSLSHWLFGHPRILDDRAVAQQLDAWEGRLAKDRNSSYCGYWEGRLARDGSGSSSKSRNKSPRFLRIRDRAEGSDNDAYDTPSYLDLALYAQFQMVFTGLSQGLASRIKERPVLVAWIHRMNGAFDDYRRTNYCRAAFPEDPLPKPLSNGPQEGLQSASLLQTAATLLTAAFLLSPFGWALLLLFLTHLHLSRLKKPEASGKKLDPTSYWGQVFAFIDLSSVDKVKCVVFGDCSGLKKLIERRLQRWRLAATRTTTSDCTEGTGSTGVGGGKVER